MYENIKLFGNNVRFLKLTFIPESLYLNSVYISHIGSLNISAIKLIKTLKAWTPRNLLHLLCSGMPFGLKIVKIYQKLVVCGRGTKRIWWMWQGLIFEVRELLQIPPGNIRPNIVIKQTWTASINHYRSNFV